MASFAGEEFLDLGELGKWKISTLEELNKLFPSPVEKEYSERLGRYNGEIETLKCSRVGFNPHLGEICFSIQKLQSFETRREALVKDFQKYYMVFPFHLG